jgi:hypothetical protein
MQKETVYTRPQVVGPFSEPIVSRSYVNWAILWWLAIKIIKTINFDQSQKY